MSLLKFFFSQVHAWYEVFSFLRCCTYFLKFFSSQVHAWYEVWSERPVVVKAPRAAERESDGRCRLHLLYTLPAPHNHSLYTLQPCKGLYPAPYCTIHPTTMQRPTPYNKAGLTIHPIVTPPPHHARAYILFVGLHCSLQITTQYDTMFRV